jgi:hypothetical protein
MELAPVDSEEHSRLPDPETDRSDNSQQLYIPDDDDFLEKTITHNQPNQQHPKQPHSQQKSEQTQTQPPTQKTKYKRALTNLHEIPKKQIRITSNNGWNNEVEVFAATIGEQCDGLHWMHNNSATFYNTWSLMFGVTAVVFGSIASMVAVVTTLLAAVTTLKWVTVLMGIITAGTVLLSAIFSGLRQFLPYDDYAVKHSENAADYLKLRNTIKLQLSSYRTDRTPGSDFTSYILRKFSDNQRVSMNINWYIKKKFKEKFNDLNIAKPHIVRNPEKINIRGEIFSTTGDVENQLYIQQQQSPQHLLQQQTLQQPQHSLQQQQTQQHSPQTHSFLKKANSSESNSGKKSSTSETKKKLRISDIGKIDTDGQKSETEYDDLHICVENRLEDVNPETRYQIERWFREQNTPPADSSITKSPTILSTFNNQ